MYKRQAAGHRAGAENIWRILERFWEHGIGYITLYAFSTENWNRPQTEVRSLIRLLDRFIKNEMDTFQKNNVQLKHLGHLEQLPLWLQNRIEAAIEATKENDGLVLSICFSYGGRDDLVTALQKIIDSEIPAHAVSEETIHNHLFTAGLPDPDLVIRTASQVQKEHKLKIGFLVGTMIELPRAAIKAGVIAKHADFFSFGTNDLTQTTFGISRDDSGKFLNDYVENKIFDIDPFISIDDSVGQLIEMASKQGKKQNKKIKLGICGEHGGDPKSINFCSKIGLNYVSCSPYRVPVARLAAAQAQLKK